MAYRASCNAGLNVGDTHPDVLDQKLVDAIPNRVLPSMDDYPNAKPAAIAFLYLYIIMAHGGEGPSFDFSVRSTLPVGAGLGSSASFSTCVATITDITTSTEGPASFADSYPFAIPGPSKEHTPTVKASANDESPASTSPPSEAPQSTPAENVGGNGTSAEPQPLMLHLRINPTAADGFIASVPQDQRLAAIANLTPPSSTTMVVKGVEPGQ